MSLIHPEKTYMCQALSLASQAAHQGEVPIGALVINADGVVIGRGWNKVEQQKTQGAHAEVEAITQATQSVGDWRLDGCWLYVTLEPCAMCYGLARLSRLGGVVYGIDSPRFGYQLDKAKSASVYKNDIQVIAGIHADESRALLQQFFKMRRATKGEHTNAGS